MPNVTRLGEEADATLMASIEDMLRDFEPVSVSAAISQATRAAPSTKTQGKKPAGGNRKRARE